MIFSGVNLLIYIETGSTDPYFNLAFEEYVFSELSRDEEYFMLWQNDNAIVIGKYQNTFEEINADYVEKHSIRVVRRLSGGGAVYHDLGNLNFTFIVDAADHKDFDFSIFVQPIIETLESFGIHAESNGRNDVTIDGRKISGNSQYMKSGRLLHHGTLMLSSDLTAVEKALRVSGDKLRSKSVKSVRSRVTTVEANSSVPVSVEKFKRLLLDNIFSSTPMKRWYPKESDLVKINALRSEKYSDWEWNFGRNPQYSIVKRRYIDGVGGISVSMELSGGCIEALSICGDYFGNKGSEELSSLLKGCRLERDALAARLSKADLNGCIAKIKAEQFIRLLLQ